MVPHTTETLILEEVMEILPLNQSSINNLSDSGELKRIKFGKRYLYYREFVYLVLQKLIDYNTVSEVSEILKDNGICDYFKNYTEKGGKMKCVYNRYHKEFPMSVTQLIKNGYLEVYEGVTPILIKNKSVVKTIQTLNFNRLNTQQPKPKSIPKPKSTKVTKTPKSKITKVTQTPSNNSLSNEEKILQILMRVV